MLWRVDQRTVAAPLAQSWGALDALPEGHSDLGLVLSTLLDFPSGIL